MAVRGASIAAVAANEDVLSALRSTGNSDMSKAATGSNSTTGLGTISGSKPDDTSDPSHWRTKRESWTYRQGRLPSAVTVKEVRFDFVSDEGYGAAVMQKDPQPMQTLGQAVEAARRDRKLN